MRQPATDSMTPGAEPAEGRPDIGVPGANQEDPADRDDRQPPDSPEAELPERLGERTGSQPDGGVATGEPDVLPNVEVPEETM